MCGYGHVILNYFLSVGCVPKGLKTAAVDTFPKGIWYC